MVMQSTVERIEVLNRTQNYTTLSKEKEIIKLFFFCNLLQLL